MTKKIKPNLQILAASLRHSDPEQRAKAAEELGELSGKARAVVPALLNALDSECILPTFWEILKAVAAIDPSKLADSKVAMDKFLVGLEKDDPQIRATAALHLGGIGPMAVSAVPALLKALNKEENSYARWKIIWALGEIRSRPDDVIPALIANLKNEEENVRELPRTLFLCLVPRPIRRLLHQFKKVS